MTFDEKNEFFEMFSNPDKSYDPIFYESMGGYDWWIWLAFVIKNDGIFRMSGGLNDGSPSTEKEEWFVEPISWEDAIAEIDEWCKEQNS